MINHAAHTQRALHSEQVPVSSRSFRGCSGRASGGCGQEAPVEIGVANDRHAPALPVRSFLRLPLVELSFRRKGLKSAVVVRRWRWTAVSWSGKGQGDAGLTPGVEMDILKSEILRKRQLVEDRNLLVVRIRGVGSCVCETEGGGRIRGAVTLPGSPPSLHFLVASAESPGFWSFPPKLSPVLRTCRSSFRSSPYRLTQYWFAGIFQISLLLVKPSHFILSCFPASPLPQHTQLP